MNKLKHYYVGFDVSKGYTDVIMLNSSKEVVEKPFQLDDNQQGHQTLDHWIREKSCKGVKLICGLESTGGYENNWVALLKKLSNQNDSLEVYRLNPKSVKHQLDSMLKRTIDDSVSAEGIAVFMANNYNHYHLNWHNSTNPVEENSEAKQLYRMIMSEVKKQTISKVQLEKLLYRAFPELLKYCKNSTPKWLLILLKQYPTAEEVRNLKLEDLQAINGVGEKKAKEIFNKAKNSVGAQQGYITRLMVQEHCSNILSQEQSINQMKDVLVKHYVNPDMEILKSIKGISDWTAACILLQLGDYNRFASTKQLAAFFGMHPSFKKSGDGKFKIKMDKQGNSDMRATLFVAASNVKIYEPCFQKLYKHHISKGKHHKSVMGILMHKLLRMIFGMLQNQEKFDASKDEENQKRNDNESQDQERHISEKLRRFQGLSTDAPISRRNYKKRRADMEHQSIISIDNTESSNANPSQT